MGRDVEEEGGLLLGNLFKHCPLQGSPAGKKTDEKKAMSRQTGNRECGRGCRWTRHRVDGNFVFPAGLNQPVPRIREKWSAGIRNQGDTLSILQLNHKGGGLGIFVMLVVAGGGGGDGKMIQELSSMPGILTGDQIHFSQDLSRTRTQILQIPQGSGHHV